MKHIWKNGQRIIKKYASAIEGLTDLAHDFVVTEGQKAFPYMGFGVDKTCSSHAIQKK